MLPDKTIDAAAAAAAAATDATPKKRDKTWRVRKGDKDSGGGLRSSTL